MLGQIQGEVPHRLALSDTLFHPLIGKPLRGICIRRAVKLEKWSPGRVRIAVRSMKSQSKVEMLTLPDSSRDSPLAKQKNC